MEEKRKIRAKEIASDVRARMTDFELTAKYGLSLDELQNVLVKLVKAGALRAAELSERGALFDDDANRKQTRRVDREKIPLRLPVVDVNEPSTWGIVRDISEKGFRVAGIHAAPDEVRTLQIRADVFSGLEPLVVEAECRWVREKGNSRKFLVAGFEITRISETHLNTLRRLVTAAAIGHSL